MNRAMLLLTVAVLAAPAAAEPRFTLRLATAAPDGTSWAREMKAFAREVEVTTRGDVHVKWYFGGIVGDEVEMEKRVRRGQIDGVASGGALCPRLAPSMRIFHLPGLFQNWDEANHVLRQLRPKIDAEFAQAGFVNIAFVPIGEEVILSRFPLQNMETLLRTKLWVWDFMQTSRAALAAMSFRSVPLSLDVAARAYDEGRVDGFVAAPIAALAWQWSAQAHYLLDLRIGFLAGCVLLANRAMDELPIEYQRAIRTAAGSNSERLEALSRIQNDELLGILFARQGVKTLQVDDAFRAAFLAAARAARDELAQQMGAHELLDEVNGWLANYRTERSGSERVRP